MRRHALVFVLAALLAPSSYAAVQRTFVSSSGLDTNPCSAAQPCRSFAAAVAQTISGGEVYVLDSAGYGPTTIHSAVTIQAEGVAAGITVFSGDGIDISIGTNDVVALRGLIINGLGGTHGIAFQAGGTLHLEKVKVSNLLGNGIENTAGGSMFIDDSVLNDNADGLHVLANAVVSADGCHFDHNNIGVAVEQGTVAVRKSSANGNALTGFRAAETSPYQATLILESCVAAYNSQGVFAQGTAASPSLGTVIMSNVAVYGNGNGLYIPAVGSPIPTMLTGSIVSFGNNDVSGNSIDGSPSATVPRV